MRRVFNWSMTLFFIGVAFIGLTNLWVVNSTKDQIYVIDQIPSNSVALVLGTSKRTSEGRPNKYFVDRMNAAASLYSEGKIRHILVSGDNSTKFYNEPLDMLEALGDLKIPEQSISLDYAGFRTFDSIVRAGKVFGQDSITIVTQSFHCYRSLFIANHSNMHGVALVASNEASFVLMLREILARSLTVLDLFVLARQPKFLGEGIVLPIEN